MQIFELSIPGSWLQLSTNDQWVFETQIMLVHGLPTSLHDAAISLALFEAEQFRLKQNQQERFQKMELWTTLFAQEVTALELEYKYKIVQSIAQNEGSESVELFLREVAKRIGFTPAEGEAYEATLIDIIFDKCLNRDERNKLSDNARQEVKRRRWASGEIPNEYEQRIIFVHARAFLYAMDRIKKILKAFCDHIDDRLDTSDPVRLKVHEQYKKFTDHFERLTDLRDSSAHFDERIQGKAKIKGKKVTLHPDPIMNSNAIHSTGGLQEIESLDGNKFIGTVSDGSLGEVEISAASVEIARMCIQETILAFSWTGPASTVPN